MAAALENGLEDATKSIISEQKMIQSNRQQRNEIYENCINGYLKHLKHQINQLQSTQQNNLKRNKNISEAFENVYDKIVTSSNITLRKIKQTSFQKKQFWENLIKNNAAMTDLELKKEFYQQKRDTEDRYFDAIQIQKAKKVPYSVLLGKGNNKKSAEQLRNWQQNNRVFEDKVNKGTTTLNQWQNVWNFAKNQWMTEPDMLLMEKGSEGFHPLQHQYNARNSRDILSNYNYQTGSQLAERRYQLDVPAASRPLINQTLRSSYDKDETDFLKSFEKKM